jgi:hypothetical protein
MNSLVFRPLPVAQHPEALVALETLSSYPYFERYRAQSSVVAPAIAFIGPVPFRIALDFSTGAKTARIFGHLGSPSCLFQTTLPYGRGSVQRLSGCTEPACE